MTRLRPMPRRLRERLLAEHGARRPVDLTTRAAVDAYLRAFGRKFKVRASVGCPRDRVHVTVTQSWWGRLLGRGARARDAWVADGARHGVCVCDHTAEVRTAGIVWPTRLDDASLP